MRNGVLNLDRRRAFGWGCARGCASGTRLLALDLLDALADSAPLPLVMGLAHLLAEPAQSVNLAQLLNVHPLLAARQHGDHQVIGKRGDLFGQGAQPPSQYG